ARWRNQPRNLPPPQNRRILPSACSGCQISDSSCHREIGSYSCPLPAHLPVP
ncbi:TIM complex component Tim54, partial [Histoplasma capsulatum]